MGFMDQYRDKRAELEQQRAERHPERYAAEQARKAQRDDLKTYVREHKRERIATFNDVHLFTDCIIRLPGLASMGSLTNLAAAPERFPIAGVRATVENSGGVGGRSTLTRTMVPGAHGWQKKVDTRESWLIIEGAGFQWAVKVEPALSSFARDFAAKATSAGNAAAPAAAPAPPSAASSVADELRKLADLRAAGVLTPREFDIAKARLLGSSAPR